MPKHGSTSFSAAKVANFGVVMAEMMGKMSEMEKEIKRLRHHVSVLSKRNHQLMKDGKSRAASPIASGASLSDEEEELEEVGMGGGRYKFTVMATEEELDGLLEDIRDGRKLGDRVKDTVRRVEERGRIRSGVVAESVALVEEAEVAEPVVRLPVAVKGEGSKKRRVDGSENEEGGKEEEEVLIAPLGPRAECGGLLRRVGRELVFAEADPRYVAGGGPSGATPVGLSRGSDARRQRPGARGGYQLRPRVGGYGFGYGGRGRGRGV